MSREDWSTCWSALWETSWNKLQSSGWTSTVIWPTWGICWGWAWWSAGAGWSSGWFYSSPWSSSQWKPSHRSSHLWWADTFCGHRSNKRMCSREITHWANRRLLLVMVLPAAMTGSSISSLVIGHRNSSGASELLSLAFRPSIFLRRRPRRPTDSEEEHTAQCLVLSWHTRWNVSLSRCIYLVHPSGCTRVHRKCLKRGGKIWMAIGLGLSQSNQTNQFSLPVEPCSNNNNMRLPIGAKPTVTS